MGFFDFMKAKGSKSTIAAPEPQTPKAFPIAAPQGRGSYALTPHDNKLEEMQTWQTVFDQSYWVRKCTKAIAYAGSKSYEIVPADPDEDVDPEKVARIETFLNSLNPQDTFESFLRKLYIELIVHGHAVCEIGFGKAEEEVVKALVEKAFNAGGFTPELLPSYEQEIQDVVGAVVTAGIPNFLRILPTQQVEIVTDGRGSIVRYVQHPVGQGKKIVFQPDQVVHILHPDSASPTYGESQIACLANLLTIDQLIDIREKNKLKSDNALDALFTIANGTVENCEAVSTEISTKYGGPEGLRFLVVGDEFKYQDISKTKDGDFLKEKLFIRDTVAMSLGVPLSVLGITEGTAGKGSGSDNHLRNFIENVVRPYAVHVEAMLNRMVLSHFQNIGIDYILKIKLEDTDDQMPIEDMYDKMIRNGSATINEVRKMRGQDKLKTMEELQQDPDFSPGDVAIFVGQGAAPVEQLTGDPQTSNESAQVQQTAPPPQEVEAEKAISEIRHHLRTLRKAL